MKCKNCGANYKTIELKCPYCRTENIIGKLWMAERSEAELEYERQRKAVGKKSSVYVIDRILTRSIWITLFAIVLLFVGMYAYAVIADKVILFVNDVNKDKIEATLKEYYENEEYEQMYNYINEKQLERDDYYGYVQAGLVNFYYNEYLNSKYAFLSMTPEEQLKDTYQLNYALRNSVMVYWFDLGVYEEVDTMNKELYEKYRKEMLSFWIGTLKLTEEEVRYFTEENKYVYSDYIDALVVKVKERCIDVD